MTDKELREECKELLTELSWGELCNLVVEHLWKRNLVALLLDWTDPSELIKELK